MMDSNAERKQQEGPAVRKPYVKPEIARIRLVPTETVLGVTCRNSVYADPNGTCGPAGGECNT